MPRGPRLDFPGALHHLMVRGIERRCIFRTDRDRDAFLDRLANLVVESAAGLYAWALMPNHAHALLRTGSLPVSRLAQRWLGPYATSFNKLHRRSGYLFQSRFKSILVEEDPYLLELVRYIHLNPVRSRLPVTIDSLDRYPWTGHTVLLGERHFPAQDVNFILSQFGTKVNRARRAYRLFVHDGLRNGAPVDLDGGGLRRSFGGRWQLVENLRRGRERWAFDERILGSSDFADRTLARFEDQPLRPPCDTAATLADLSRCICDYFEVSHGELASSTLRRPVLHARAVLCDLAVRHHAISINAVARFLSVSHTSVARALSRASSTYAEYHCAPVDFLDRDS